MTNFNKPSNENNENNAAMPQHLRQTELAQTWEGIRSLAQEQGVDPQAEGVTLDKGQLSAEALAALAAVGGAKMEDADGRVNVRLAFAEANNDEEPEDPSIVAASKPHTFA